MPFLHQARREACGNYVAPSTSILEPALLVPGASTCMEVLAVTSDAARAVTPVYPEGLDVLSTSSFAPVSTAGDFVFVAGFLAAHGVGDLGGIAPEARIPEGHLWKGNRIQLEADYIMRKTLIPALKGAGSSLENVVKAQVYLADIEDVPAFNQVWQSHFGSRIPATTFVPTSDPGFAIAEARCEINLVALKDAGSTRAQAFASGPFPACDGHPIAIRAADLLLFSGMVASDENGLIREACGSDARAGIETQMEYLLEAAETTCKAAGTSLANVVRIQQFHTDLREFPASSRAWQKRLPDQPLPISAIQVPAPLIVPGCTAQLDLWVYVP